VTLLGLRGAGKSTIGRAASERLAIPFVELDAEVERRAGMSSGEIFELHGRTYYYRLERQELERLAAVGHRAIVATAGSIVTDHPSLEHLLSTTVTIWLRAKPEDHYRRVLAQGDARPMENRADAMLELRGLLHARRALYERARHVVDTSSLGLSRSIDRVVRITRAEPRERTSS
jgi:XRE family transcriptional regulator, aerobic/anaerobic benzoate catabolism transcriptional regulator